MASIVRSLRPVASRFSARPCSFAPTKRWTVPSVRAFSASSPAQVKKYTREHEWVELSDDGKSAVIGISEYAAHALGDVVYVELPTLPMEVAAGDSIGAVESVKSASDINSPVACKITAVNELLEETPGTINKGPEDDSSAGGWIAKVEISEEGTKDLEKLMSHKEYKAFTEEE